MVFWVVPYWPQFSIALIFFCYLLRLWQILISFTKICVKTCTHTHLGTCREVVIHCQWDFGLFTTDYAVWQGEVDEEGLKCAQFSSLSQT